MNSNVAQRLRSTIERRFAGGPFELTARQLANKANSSEQDATSVLAAFANEGKMTRESRLICGCEREEVLTVEEAQDPVCAHCGLAFNRDVTGGPREIAVYKYAGAVNRDVLWMLTLHGMNTRGAWQEEFMWRVARTYGYSLPVAIYKYGIVRPGAVLKFRQRVLTRQLLTKMHALIGDTEASGLGSRPDVIAHSLGTWLLGHALQDDPNLRVGRVILLGCILRPDFDWGRLFRRNQVEAVLCHHSAIDGWVRAAQYVIPDSGPSGRSGFNDREHIMHVAEQDLAHSDYFLPNRMPELFKRVWDPFLTKPLAEVCGDHRIEPMWKPTPLVLRATVPRFLLLGVVAIMLAAALAVFLLGLLWVFERYWGH